MTAQQILACRSNRSEFSTLTGAQSCRERSVSYGTWAIILGDNRKFWVMTNREASILVKAGYQYAE